MVWIPCFGPRVFEVFQFLLLETTFAHKISVFWVGGASNSKNQQPQSQIETTNFVLGNLFWCFLSWHDMNHPSRFSRSVIVIGECHLGGLQFWFGQVEGAFVSLWFGMVKKFTFHSGRTNIAGLGKYGPFWDPFWRCIFYWKRDI